MKPRVLIVDDNLPNLELAAYVLEQDGFEVARATNAADARREAAAVRPDVVLMDIQMPDEDGLAAARRFKADPAMRGVAIVAFTAYAMRGDAQRILAAGCDGYIAKPVDPLRLAEQVRAFLAP